MPRETSASPAAARPRRPLLGALAVALSLLATLLLRVPSWRLAAGGLLALAGALAVRAFGRSRPRLAFAPLAPGSRSPPFIERRALGATGLVLAALFALGADYQYLAEPQQPFGLAGALWLVALVLLIGSGIRLSRAAPVAAPDLPWAAWERVLFAGLVLLAFSLRLWNLRDVPFNVYPDEIMSGQVATRAYLHGPAPSVFSTVWSDVDLPALWFALVAAGLRLFGTNLAVLRLPAALFGAATTIPLYGLVRSAWGRVAAIAATAILAFSAANLGYSRAALNNIVTPFFWTLLAFFLLRGLRRDRPLDWVLAGVAGGLSEYIYYGTRLLPFLLVVFAGYLLVTHRARALRLWRGAGLLVLGYFVAFGPLLSFYLIHPGQYLGRGAMLSGWIHFPRDLPDLGRLVATLWSNMAEALLGISTTASQDFMYFAPLFLPLEAAFLVLGVALLLRQWRHPAEFLLLLMGGGVIFVGDVLVVRNAHPFLAHWTPGFAAFYAAIGVALGAWAGKAPKGWRLRLGLRRVVVRRAACIGGLLVVLGGANIRYYFHDYYADVSALAPSLRAAQLHYEGQAAQSRWQATLGRAYQVITIGPTTQPYDAATAHYLGADQPWALWQNPERTPPPPAAAGRGLAFVFFPDAVQHRDAVVTHYPGGRPGKIVNPRGRTLFHTYVVARRERPRARATAAPSTLPLRPIPDAKGFRTGRGASRREASSENRRSSCSDAKMSASPRNRTFDRGKSSHRGDGLGDGLGSGLRIAH